MSEPAPNEELRAHVTSVGFALTLGKTHIASLVQLDRMLAENRHLWARGRDMFIPGVLGLERRGLVVHTMPPPPEARRRKNGTLREVSVRRIWRITRAGRLVLGLLKEAGLYDEYAGRLHADYRVRLRRVESA
jgi:hypothetical protein